MSEFVYSGCQYLYVGTERMVRCPSNLIGWRVRHRDDPNAGFGIVLKYVRTPYTNATTQAQQQPRTNQYADGEDKLLIRFENKQVWCNPWKEPLILVEKALGNGVLDTNAHTNVNDPHEFDCGWISFSRMNSHLHMHCKHRSVWVQALSDVYSAVDVAPTDMHTLTQGSSLLAHAIEKTNTDMWDFNADGDDGRNEDVNSWAAIKRAAKNKQKMYSSTQAANNPHTHSGSAPNTRSGSNTPGTLNANNSFIRTFGTIFEGDNDDNVDLDSISNAGSGTNDDAMTVSNSNLPSTNKNELSSFSQRTPTLLTANNSFVDNVFGVNNYYVGQHTTAAGVEQTVAQRQNLDTFVGTDVNTINCDACGKLIPNTRNTIEAHRKNDCPQTLQRCVNGCGTVIPRYRMNKHTASECPKRPVVCELCNDASLEIWAEELEAHKQRKCMQRPVECSLGCGKTGLVFVTEEVHRSTECPNRIIRCMCGQLMKECEYEVHKIADCSEVQTLCPQGCGMYIRKDLVDNHVEKLCVNKSYFFLKYVFCPLGCGVRVMKKDVLEHVAYHCDKRLSECPLKCGNSIQYCRLEQHVYFCMNRRICCEPGMNSCETFVHRWFYSLNGDNPHVSTDELLENEMMEIDVDADDGLMTVSTMFPSVPVSAHTQLLQQASVEQSLSSASLNGGGVFGNSLSFDGPSASYTNELAGGYLSAVYVNHGVVVMFYDCRFGRNAQSWRMI
jgi:hypothetical protein